MHISQPHSAHSFCLLKDDLLHGCNTRLPCGLDARFGEENWSWKVVQMLATNERLFLVGRLTIKAEDGILEQEATGTELLKCNSFGDPSSNAEAMCMRRCCAKFGLSRFLWDN